MLGRRVGPPASSWFNRGSALTDSGLVSCAFLLGLLHERVSADILSARDICCRRVPQSGIGLLVLIILFFDMFLNLLTVLFMLPFFVFMLCLESPPYTQKKKKNQDLF